MLLQQLTQESVRLTCYGRFAACLEGNKLVQVQVAVNLRGRWKRSWANLASVCFSRTYSIYRLSSHLHTVFYGNEACSVCLFWNYIFIFFFSLLVDCGWLKVVDFFGSFLEVWWKLGTCGEGPWAWTSTSLQGVILFCPVPRQPADITPSSRGVPYREEAAMGIQCFHMEVMKPLGIKLNLFMGNLTSLAPWSWRGFLVMIGASFVLLVRPWTKMDTGDLGEWAAAYSPAVREESLFSWGG